MEERKRRREEIVPQELTQINQEQITSEKTQPSIIEIKNNNIIQDTTRISSPTRKRIEPALLNGIVNIYDSEGYMGSNKLNEVQKRAQVKALNTRLITLKGLGIINQNTNINITKIDNPSLILNKSKFNNLEYNNKKMVIIEMNKLVKAASDKEIIPQNKIQEIKRITFVNASQYENELNDYYIILAKAIGKLGIVKMSS